MARNHDFDFSRTLLAYLQSEWIKSGGTEFEKSIDDIIKKVFTPECTMSHSSKRNKTWEYIQKLENSGRIQITKGTGSKGNKYIVVDSKISEEISEIQQEYESKEDYLISKGTSLIQEFANELNERKNKEVILTRELNYIKSELIKIEFFSNNPDGKAVFTTTNGNVLMSIINQIKLEQKKEEQKEEESTK
jgi:regulator of PEP synthase PpsR (kinase-PPPase family)